MHFPFGSGLFLVKAMDTQGLLEKHADTEFQPIGKDDTGAFMILDDKLIHIRNADVLMSEGQTLREIWPFVDAVRNV